MSLLFPDQIELPEVSDKEQIQNVIDIMERLLNRGDLEYAHERLFAKSLKKIAEIVKERL